MATTLALGSAAFVKYKLKPVLHVIAPSNYKFLQLQIFTDCHNCVQMSEKFARLGYGVVYRREKSNEFRYDAKYLHVKPQHDMNDATSSMSKISYKL